MPLYFPLQLTPLSRLFPLEGTKYYLYIQCTCNKFKKCNASVANSRDTENLLDLLCDGTFLRYVPVLTQLIGLYCLPNLEASIV